VYSLFEYFKKKESLKGHQEARLNEKLIRVLKCQYEEISLGILTLRDHKKCLQRKRRKFLHELNKKGFLSMDVCDFKVVWRYVLIVHHVMMF